MKKLVNKSKVRKREKLFTKVFCGIIGITIVVYIFFNQLIIGKDWRYYAFFVLLPFILGQITLLILFRTWLKEAIYELKGFIRKAVAIVCLFIGGLFISYLSFGTVAAVIWNYANKAAAQNEPVEIFVCEVKAFKSFRSSSYFAISFLNKRESIRTTYKEVKTYLPENPTEYDIVLTVRKGLWSCYIVDNYEIRKK